MGVWGWCSFRLILQSDNERDRLDVWEGERKRQIYSDFPAFVTNSIADSEVI